MIKLLVRLVRGVATGLIGTLAMDLLWWRRYRDAGGEDGFLDWEFASGVGSFENASAPGQVGQKVAGLLSVDLPDEAAATTTNVVHWLTGAGYGVGHELAHGDERRGRHPVAVGAATGVGAFANSYATLGAMGVYAPIWEYDLDTLRSDLTAHLVFGMATGVAHAALSGREQR